MEAAEKDRPLCETLKKVLKLTKARPAPPGGLAARRPARARARAGRRSDSRLRRPLAPLEGRRGPAPVRSAPGAGAAPRPACAWSVCGCGGGRRPATRPAVDAGAAGRRAGRARARGLRPPRRAQGWELARDHAMTAVGTDNQMRIWYSDSPALDGGLLFKCALGSVDLENPVGARPAAHPAPPGGAAGKRPVGAF